MMFGFGGDREFESSALDLLHNLRLAIVRVMRDRDRDLGNAEAIEALENAAQTVRTRTSGLIYDYRSANPRVQRVTDELALVLDRHQKGEQGFHRVEGDILSRTLRYLKRQFELAEKRGASYLDLAAQTVGNEYAAQPSGDNRGIVSPGHTGERLPNASSRETKS